MAFLSSAGAMSGNVAGFSVAATAGVSSESRFLKKAAVGSVSMLVKSAWCGCLAAGSDLYSAIKLLR